MGVQVSFGFGNFRLILRAPEGHTTGGGTDEGRLTEAVVEDSQGMVLGRRVFFDALDLVGQLCPGIVRDKSTAAVRLEDDDYLDLPVPAPDSCDTIPDGMEYLGSYASIRAYLRAMLEPEVTPACAWILEHLDYQAAQRRWESDGSRLVIECGHVYRLAAPGDVGDPPGPWMPTRG